MYTLLGPDGPYASAEPGELGGHRRSRIYGHLDCPSAARAIARGGYVEHRVFFADEATARATGYRPCAVCLPREYRDWKNENLVTATEIAALTRLLTELPAKAVTIGSNRDGPSRTAAACIAEAWENAGGTVLDVVDWPSTAASWLRQARRFTAHGPDAWVLTGGPAGLLPMVRRLTDDIDFTPARTIATASLNVPLIRQATELLGGLRGVTRDGLLWTVDV